MFKHLNEPKVGNIFRLLAFLMFFVLFGCSLVLTGENSMGFSDENIYFKRDSVLYNAAALLGAALFFFFFGKVSVFFRQKWKRNILLAVCCVIAAAISFYWVSGCGAGPVADQAQVVAYAADFNQGDFSGLQKGSYVAKYPQQLGMITFLRLLFLLFGEENYFSFQVFSIVSVCILLIAGCMMVRELSGNDEKAELYYLFFSMTCFPMYAYTSFVYGDLVSVPFVFLAVWALLSAFRKFRIWKLVGMGLSIGFAVMLRTNVLIAVIAMVIVVLVKFLFGSKRQALACGTAILLGIFLFRSSVDALYAAKRDKEAESIPAICYVVMGLNDDNSHPGWYNSYGVELFEKNQFDAEATSRQAFADLRSYVGVFAGNPFYMVDFFARKMNSQWNAPMYQSLAMNDYLVAEQSPLIAEIYSGEGIGAFLEEYMQLYQLVIYGSILILLITGKKSGEGIEGYTLLIGVFGGFLFSMMWEAKTRYVFPYLLMMLPYAALGLRAFAARMDGLGRRLKRKKETGEKDSIASTDAFPYNGENSKKEELSQW